MEMFYAIKIIDSNGQAIGELMQASPEYVMKYIEKGFTVINKATNEVLTVEEMQSTVGVSDGFINIG